MVINISRFIINISSMSNQTLKNLTVPASLKEQFEFFHLYHFIVIKSLFHKPFFCTIPELNQKFSYMILLYSSHFYYFIFIENISHHINRHRSRIIWKNILLMYNGIFYHGFILLWWR